MTTCAHFPLNLGAYISAPLLGEKRKKYLINFFLFCWKGGALLPLSSLSYFSSNQNFFHIFLKHLVIMSWWQTWFFWLSSFEATFWCHTRVAPIVQECLCYLLVERYLNMKSGFWLFFFLIYSIAPLLCMKLLLHHWEVFQLCVNSRSAGHERWYGFWSGISYNGKLTSESQW